MSAVVEAATGLAPDFSDCRSPTPHPDASGVAYRVQARRMIEALGAHLDISANGPHPLLFTKLASALTHVDVETPRRAWWFPSRPGPEGGHSSQGRERRDGELPPTGVAAPIISNP